MVVWHHRLNGLVWVNSGSWWWTGRPDKLQSTELQSWTWLSDWLNWIKQKKKKIRRRRRKRCGKNKQKNYTKKDLHDPDNHDGGIIHLEPDILECEVKWKHHYKQSSLKWRNSSWAISNPQMMLCRCCIQYASKFGKLSCDHRTRKDQFSFQSQRKAMSKNAQTIAQLHSSHTLAK